MMEQLQPFEDQVPAYPVQNALTGALRRAAAQAGNADYLSLWAGQGVAVDAAHAGGGAGGQAGRRMARRTGQPGRARVTLARLSVARRTCSQAASGSYFSAF